MTANAITTSPYLLEEPPISSGRTMLAVAFEHYCVIMWGLCGTDIAEAFDDSSEAVDEDRRRVRIAAGLLGRVFADGLARTYARAIGGGDPVELRAADWELDDFSLRFATSRVNPSAPYGSDAQRTHWVFVDTADFNQVLEASFGDPDIREHVSGPAVIVNAPAVAFGIGEERLLRLPEVKRRTGMSRSTIYSRMNSGRFPATVSMTGNIAAWRETEILDWITNPR